MRIFAVIPIVAAIGLFGFGHDEPSERDMRIAFESALALQVRNAIEFVAEITDYLK